MPRELFEKDIGELALLFGMIKVGRRLSHCKLNWGDGQRRRQHTKPHWSPKVDPSLLLRSVAFGLLPSGLRVRNSFSDSCNVTVKIGADLQRLRKVRLRSPRSTPPKYFFLNRTGAHKTKFVWKILFAKM